jgi:hypothetical protein
LTNEFRLAYLQDADANPDGGFPVLTDGLPPAEPAQPLRQALKTNDQRAWTPTSPMLLCAGDADPTVLYLNTALMQNFWSAETTVTVLDIDSDVASDDPYEAQKTQFAIAKELAAERRRTSARSITPGCHAVLLERRQVVLRRHRRASG